MPTRRSTKPVAVQTHLWRPEDRAPVVAALIDLQAFEHRLHDTRVPGSRRRAETYLRRLLAQRRQAGGAVLVAERAGRFVGFVACHIVHDPTPNETRDSLRFGLISDVYVVPEHRGGRIARALVNTAIAHLAPFNVRRVRIQVLERNLPARRAYGRAGFRPYELVLERRIPPRRGVRRRRNVPVPHLT